jgi:DNA-nicking Smr family endonuclease
MASSSPDDDDDAFAQAMKGVRPLAETPARVIGGAQSGQPAGEDRRARRASRSAVAPFIVERAQDSVAGRATDVSAHLLRELRGGQRPIEARVDLHGRVRAESLRALERFVLGARARGCRVGLVIHGRGHGSADGDPILRPAIWDWLGSAAAHRAGVMAFASARPADGGAGATLVLLRRA